MTVNTLVLNGMRQYRCTGEGLCRIGDSFSTPGNLPGFLPLKFLEFFRNSLPTRFYAVKFTDGRNTGKRVDNLYILLSVPFLYSQFFLFNLFLLICPPLFLLYQTDPIDPAKLLYRPSDKFERWR